MLIVRLQYYKDFVPNKRDVMEIINPIYLRHPDILKVM
jgi:hypothetical protein